MQNNTLKNSGELKERVKELSCLYDLSKIANSPTLSFEEVLQLSAERIPRAWVYSDHAVCEITISQNVFVSKEIPSPNISQLQNSLV